MDIRQFLDIVQNADTYKKYLKDMDDRETSIKSAIELHGKASEIPVLHDRALKVIKDAEDKAKKITDAAETAAQSIRDEARRNQLEVQTLLDRALVDTAALKAEKKAVSEQASQLVAQKKEVSDTLARISEYEKSLSKRDTELSDKLAKINSVLR